MNAVHRHHPNRRTYPCHPFENIRQPAGKPRPQRLPALIATFFILSLGAACTTPPRAIDNQRATNAIRNELAAVAQPRASAPVPASISDALLSPGEALPKRQDPAAEPRFDLIVSAAQAREVFQSLVADTRYSMLIDPKVTGTLSATLRGVTMREALESIRDVYGYDFKIDGRRIVIYPPTLQTRIFTVNYLNSKRESRSEVRVNAGAQTGQLNNGGNGQANNGIQPPVNDPNNNQNNNQNNNNQNSNNTVTSSSSRVSTTSRTDFWGEIETAIKGIVSASAGSNVTISPQAGIVAVYAMPTELRQVEAYLRAARIAVERQVMLEAKIVEVELRDGFQSGIDWSILSGIDLGGKIRGRSTVGVDSGSIRNNFFLGQDTPPTPTTGNQAPLVDALGFPANAGGLFGLAFSATGFQAVLGFLETYGNVQTLSSPRVATLNNQKAVLKVGADEYFITGVSGGSAQIANNNNNNNVTLPTVTLTPFFSGIALDVTPQIDDGDMITLHVHPAISKATEKTKQVNLGIAGNYLLPLAISNVNETDTIVRVIDGNIVAIGGLMQIDSNDSASGLPGTTNAPFFSYLFGNKQRTARKKELVVLLKPTIIRGADDWSKQTSISKDLLDSSSEPRRVITLDGNPAKAESK